MIMWMYLLIACTGKQASPKLKNRLGSDFANRIFLSSNYTLSVWNGAPADPLKLRPAEQLAVQKFLRSPDSYVFSANVRCRLRPDRVLELQEDGRSYQILFSHKDHCPKMRFVSADKQETLSLKPEAHKRFQTYIR